MGAPKVMEPLLNVPSADFEFAVKIRVSAQQWQPISGPPGLWKRHQSCWADIEAALCVRPPATHSRAVI
jgi:hypothetical protein